MFLDRVYVLNGHTCGSINLGNLAVMALTKDGVTKGKYSISYHGLSMDPKILK